MNNWISLQQEIQKVAPAVADAAAKQQEKLQPNLVTQKNSDI